MKDLILIREPFGKEEYDRMYELRWEVFRSPWNQPRGSEKDELDSNYERVFHFIALLDNNIIGTARFHINNEHEGEIKYLAVNENYRCQGIGKKIIDHIEHIAIGLGIPYIKLNSIKTAQCLFEKLDYQIIGEGPLLFNQVKQYRMGKNIIPLLTCL